MKALRPKMMQPIATSDIKVTLSSGIAWEQMESIRSFFSETLKDGSSMWDGTWNFYEVCKWAGYSLILCVDVERKLVNVMALGEEHDILCGVFYYGKEGKHEHIKLIDNKSPNIMEWVVKHFPQKYGDVKEITMEQFIAQAIDIVSEQVAEVTFSYN